MKFRSLCAAFGATLLATTSTTEAFVAPRISTTTAAHHHHAARTGSVQLNMDMVTYLRTEWISAALCTNQTPRSADVCLQLGSQDGRIVTFVPRTIREIITSTIEADGKLTVSACRQLKQQQERRKAAVVKYVDQRADDLKETADESVDVVMSLQAVEKMMENGLDWKRSVREAARVLKPGGRLLFVEQTDLAGESYLDYLDNLYSISDEEQPVGEAATEGLLPIFEEVGYDDVDLVLVPHIAGVAIKSPDAGLTPQERARKQSQMEEERIAEISIEAYERGIKRRRKKKNKADAQAETSIAKQVK